MSYVSVLPATLATAATEVARIGSALSLASAVAAAQTSAVQAAAADEVSAAIAALFSAHGRDFQALSARAAAFHHEFVQALAAGAGSYAVAEIAAASPLQSLIDVFNAPDAPNAVVHVSCGHVARSLWAVIVDPDTGPEAPGRCARCRRPATATRWCSPRARASTR